MIEHDLLLLDRLTALENRALEGIGPKLSEGARLTEAERRADQALGWLDLAQQGCDPADRTRLTRARAHLVAARQYLHDALT